MYRIGLILAASLVLAACSHSEKHTGKEKVSQLTLDVYTASPAGFGANSTIIMGESEAILVDSQFIKSEATKVVERIQASGRDLTTIFITHAHPDHFFGARTVKQAYPDAQVVTIASVAEIYPEIAAKKAAANAERQGDEFPGEPVEIDQVVSSSLTLEGNQIEIIEGLAGDTTPTAALYVPSLNAFMAGDIVYENMYAWTADADADLLAEWVTTLNELDNNGYDIVVAGHSATGTHDPAAIAETAAYVTAFSQAVDELEGSAAVIEAMQEQFPDLKAGKILELGAKVHEGEMKWN